MTHQRTMSVVFATLLAACQPQFTDADVQKVKEEIRSEFAKRPGVTVQDVQIIKESAKRLSGFVKVEVEGFEQMMSCSANMGEDAQYIWKCE